MASNQGAGLATIQTLFKIHFPGYERNKRTLRTGLLAQNHERSDRTLREPNGSLPGGVTADMALRFLDLALARSDEFPILHTLDSIASVDVAAWTKSGSACARNRTCLTVERKKEKRTPSSKGKQLRRDSKASQSGLSAAMRPCALVSDHQQLGRIGGSHREADGGSSRPCELKSTSCACGIETKSSVLERSFVFSQIVHPVHCFISRLTFWWQ